MPSGEFRIVHGEESRCEALAESISAYVDGALDSVLRQEVEAHLRTCPACAAEMARLERLATELRDLVKVQPPAVVWERVRAATGQPAAGGALAARTRRRLDVILSQWLLAGYDGELAERIRETGTCREGSRSPHGKVAVLLGVLLSLHLLSAGVGVSLVGGIVGTLLLWLASTRLESRISSSGLIASVFLGAAVPGGWEIARASTGAEFGPFALSAAIAALATTQAMLLPRLRPRVLGLLRVPCVARTAAMLLLAGGAARPDLVGPLAAVPVIAGAAGGALATWTQSRRAA